tara:strand:+ start:1658 stop:2251 length:594 start_codon:yes stop_codon:yes gene_type:complete
MEDSVNKLFRARKTVCEMIKDRGYDIEDSLNVDINMFRKMFHTNKIDIHIINEKREIYIKFLTMFKTKPNSIRDIISEIKKEIFTLKDNNLVIITLSKPNNTILKIKNEFTNIEFFWLNRLIVNITHHEYVPLHEIIKPDTIPFIMEKFNLSNIYQLPLIDKNDPICRYYNFKSGDVCKITRNNRFSGNSIIYRLVK